MSKIKTLLIAGVLALSLNSCTKTSNEECAPSTNGGNSGNTNGNGGSSKSYYYTDSFTVKANSWEWSAKDSSYYVYFDRTDLFDPSFNNFQLYVWYSSSSKWEIMPDSFEGTSFSFAKTSYGYLIRYYSIDGSDPGEPGENDFLIDIEFSGKQKSSGHKSPQPSIDPHTQTPHPFENRFSKAVTLKTCKKR